MIVPRIIPCLLLQGKGLVKGINFKNHRYIGDPINAVKIFSEKEADELLFLDITASKENRIISLPFVKKIADECYMPFGVGGGIQSIEHIRALLNAGAEKVSINSAAVTDPEFIREAADIFGSQSILVSIDVRKNLFGNYRLYSHCGTKAARHDLFAFVKKIENCGAGEIFINSIDKDGTMNGYDLNLVKEITNIVGIPVIACGGAGSLSDITAVIDDAGASAAAAGSYFVFHGKKRGILISYPDKDERETLARFSADAGVK